MLTTVKKYRQCKSIVFIKDRVSKDFLVFVKKLFQNSGPLIDILNLPLLSCGQVASI